MLQCRSLFKCEKSSWLNTVSLYDTNHTWTMSKVKLLEEVDFLRFWSAWHPEVHSNVITALSSLTALGGCDSIWPMASQDSSSLHWNELVTSSLLFAKVRFFYCSYIQSLLFPYAIDHLISAGVLSGIAILTKTGDHCVLSYGKLASHSDQASNRHESRFFCPWQRNICGLSFRIGISSQICSPTQVKKY